VEIIVSPKSLERQIKMLDERILELQAEVAGLEKKREACHVLLGIPLAPVTAALEVAPVSVKKTSPRKKRENDFAESEETSAPLDNELAESADQEPVHSAH
jgi:hypothetical protein